MPNIDRPFTFLEGKVAVFYANADGTPLRDPNTNEIKAPVAQCHASVQISSNTTEQTSSLANWTGAMPNTKRATWTAKISHITAAYKNSQGNIASLIPPDTFLILVVRHYDKISGNWTLLQLHHAHLADDDSTGSINSNQDSISIRAGHREVFTGNTSQATLPPLTPRCYATVEWEHNGLVIPCFHYDPDTETWHENPLNSFTPTGETESVRYAYIGPDADHDTQALVKYLAIRTKEGTPAGNQMPRSGLEFFTTTALTIGNHTNGTHHGIVLNDGHELQTLGCPEPVEALASSNHWSHPTLRFRFLSRIYASISHGTIAIPSITTAIDGLTPPFDTPIWIAPNGTPNPATGFTGLTLLPYTGILDGTVAG